MTVTIAVVLEVADSTIVNTALPAIRDALQSSPAEMQWIIAGYLLSLGSLLLLGGRLGDAFGYRRVFLAGVAAFVIASAFCGMAQSPQQLVMGRLVQGAAGAIMAPQSMAIVQHLYTPLERVSKLALFGLVIGLAAIIGPIVGGSLIALDLFGFGWRLIFLVNLPIGGLALVMGYRTLPHSRSHTELRVDPVGAAIFAVGFGAVLFALIRGAEAGSSLLLPLPLAVGLFLLFYGWRRARQRRKAHQPSIIAPELFSIATFRWGIVAALAYSAAFIGFLLIFSVSLQQGLGFSPLQTALIHIPFGFGVMAGVGLLVPRLLPRLGRRLPFWGGILVLISVLLVLGAIRFGHETGPLLLALLAVLGVGFGSLSGPLGPIVVAEIDRNNAGTASATLRTAQQLGGAFGIAVVGGAYFWVTGVSADAALAGLVPASFVITILLVAAVAAIARLPSDIFAREVSSAGNEATSSIDV